MASFRSNVGEIRVLVSNNTLDGHLSEAVISPIVDYVDELCRKFEIMVDRLQRGVSASVARMTLPAAFHALETTGLGDVSIGAYNPVVDRVCLLMLPGNRLGTMENVLGAEPTGCHALSRLEIGGWRSSTLLRYQMPVPSRVRQLVIRGRRRLVCCRADPDLLVAAGIKTQAAGVDAYTDEEFSFVAEFCRNNGGQDKILSRGTITCLG